MIILLFMTFPCNQSASIKITFKGCDVTKASFNNVSTQDTERLVKPFYVFLIDKSSINFAEKYAKREKQKSEHHRDQQVPKARTHIHALPNVCQNMYVCKYTPILWTHN